MWSPVVLSNVECQHWPMYLPEMDDKTHNMMSGNIIHTASAHSGGFVSGYRD